MNRAVERPDPVCHAVACRMVAGRRQTMGEAGFRHYLATQARHRQHLAAVAAAESSDKAAQHSGNQAGWQALRGLHTALAASDANATWRVDAHITEVLLPSGPCRSRALSPARLQRYRQHLLTVIAQARALPPGVDGLAQQPADDTERAGGASSLPGRLCAACGGGCCTRGGEHAYLSAATLRRVLDAQGDRMIDDDTLAAAYLERVEATPRAGSCINHGAGGCGLPRALRSDICNRFACDALGRLLTAAHMPDIVLVVQRSHDHWRRAEPRNALRRYAMISETVTRRLRPADLDT